ncbi:type II toxin-antitoxin system YoeB family toxin [Mammaliicoccus fleurettii]|nr:type II toxin-antitoxin system YoeB family toxin [Mammaliicoccus fleurettii]MEB7781284.1 type II toxin-antitoxin system YoeB family toxin [Mammaliicoccus fleurettii]
MKDSSILIISCRYHY